MKARRAREPARTTALTEGEHPAKAAAGCSRGMPIIWSPFRGVWHLDLRAGYRAQIIQLWTSRKP
jgi:hypothetical protein